MRGVLGSCIWFTILISAGLMTQCQGESVSLTVEGGVSLVGEQCPGTVRLFCTATELSSLQWKYNMTREIVTFFPDSIPSNRTETGNLAFLSVVLTNVSRSPQIANYSTYLTVELGQLQAESITSISCGNPDVLETEQVDVIIRQQLTLDSPRITAVGVRYQSGLLISLEVIWEKTQNVCSIYASSFVYGVTLSGSDPVRTESSYSNCGDVSCVASFTNLTGMTGQYEISIVAFNEVGISSASVFSTPIEKRHPLPVVSVNFTTDCLIVGRCVSEDSLNTICTVRYTTDSTYMNFSDSITTLSNEEFNISRLSPSTTYYFEFSFMVSNSLFVTNQVQTTTQAKSPCDSQTVEDSRIAFIAFLPVVLIVFAVVVPIAVLCRYQRKKKRKPHDQNVILKESKYQKASDDHRGVDQSQWWCKIPVVRNIAPYLIEQETSL